MQGFQPEGLQKGKVVLVDFWATVVLPVVAEVPNIVDAYKKYHGKGFEVIGVSLDKTDDAIVKFVEAPEAALEVHQRRG